MHTDSEDASQSFDTVREPEGSAVRPRNPQTLSSHSGQKYHNITALHRGSVVDTSNHKQSTGDDEDMSPRFLTGKENINNSNVSTRQKSHRPHSKSGKVCSLTTEQSILMSLPREDLVELVLNTRKQLKQYIQALDEKQSKFSRLKTKYRELSEQMDRVNSNNEKLVDYIRQQQQAERSSPKEAIRSDGSSGKRQNTKTRSTKLHNSSMNDCVSDPDLDATTTSELMLLTDSESPDELLSKVRTLKQSSKFVCSLYKLIDQYTQDKYFGSNYSLSSAWSFVKKLFKEYFDESWIKSNSVVVQLQQLLNCPREELNNRVLNMMRDMNRLNCLVERFKIDAGLFWINQLDELEMHLDGRDRRHSQPNA